MRCPTCRRDTLIALNDPSLNKTVVRRCLSCGQTWQPLVVRPEQMQGWLESQEKQERRNAEWWESYIDQMAREIVNKARRGLPVAEPTDT